MLKNLRSIALETIRHIGDCNLLLIASSLAYTTILSIIPALAVSFAIFQVFGGMKKLYGTVVPLILNNLAAGAGDQVVAKLGHFVQNGHTNAIGIGGLIGLVITSMAMLNSIEKAINHVWGAPLKRNFFQRVASYGVFITLGPVALSVLVGIVTSASLPVSKVFPNGTGVFAFGIGGFFCLYKFIPSCRVRSLYAFTAAVMTSISCEVARWLYVLYTDRVLTYHKLYGSLGAIPIVLLWIYILWVIVLVGAAFSAVLQKRLEKKIELLLRRSMKGPFVPPRSG